MSTFSIRTSPLHPLRLDSAWPDPPASPPFTCSASAAGTGAASVQVAGELDYWTAPRLREILRQAQGDAGVVVLDLRALEFADSSGVHAIIDAHDRAELRGDRLDVVRGAPQIQRLFDLTGAAGILHFIDGSPAEHIPAQRRGTQDAA